MTNSMDDRLARLEGRLRAWMVLSVVAVVVALASIATVVVTRRVPDAVTARAFFLVDEKGEELAKLVRHPTAGPVLVLKASEGSVMLGSFGPDAGVTVVGKGEAVVTIAVGKNGGPSLSLGDKNRRAWLSLGDEGSPSILLKDGSGQFLATTTQIGLKDASGKDVFRAGPEGAR
jgi:hypothetical protein